MRSDPADPRYILNRATRVLQAETACLAVELHRRLGEVGQPRLDPRLVDLSIHSEIAKEEGEIIQLTRNDFVFYALSATPAVKADYVAEHKSLLYEKALRLKDAPTNLEAVRSMIVLAARDALSDEGGICIQVSPPDSLGPRSLVLSGACGREQNPFAVFASNELIWIYPHSREVWVALGHCCADEVALPVLIARQFHPSCYGLFKTIGMLGHPTYKLYFCPDVWPDFERVRVVLGFPTAPTDRLDERLSSFFDRTLPRQSARALGNLCEVADLLSEFASSSGLARSDLDPQSRLRVFESFLSRLPST
ncbi:MAG: hypothetical protein WBB22_15265, partial [Anaerolineae bacterium]